MMRSVLTVQCYMMLCKVGGSHGSKVGEQGHVARHPTVQCVVGVDVAVAHAEPRAEGLV